MVQNTHALSNHYLLGFILSNEFAATRISVGCADGNGLPSPCSKRPHHAVGLGVSG